MYISLWENSRGHPDNVVLCNFLRKLMVWNKKIHRALRTPTTLMNNIIPIREIFNFHHLPKLYFGFKPWVMQIFISTYKQGPIKNHIQGQVMLIPHLF